MFSIALNKLFVNLKVGCHEDERHKPQKIRISCQFYFPEMPKSCVNDELEDTVCYKEVADAIKEHCIPKEYKLIEHLAYDIYLLLQGIVPAGVKMTITITKHDPLKEGMGSESEFIFSDYQ